MDMNQRSDDATGRGRAVHGLLIALWLVVASAALFPAIGYYIAPLVDRPYSELHDLYRPSGTIGHGMGIIGSLMMLVGVGSYSARKRMRSLDRLGDLQGWLMFHVFLCTLGPWLVLLHTTFRFGGIVSIAFWSMTLVTLSGIFGRYVYTRIPKSMNGQFLSLQALRERYAGMVSRIATLGYMEEDELKAILGPGAEPVEGGLVSSVLSTLKYDLSRRRIHARVGSVLTDRNVPRETRETMVGLIDQQARLQHQMAVLDPFQRLFRYWHVFHLPLAILMLVIMLIHVFIAILFGYVWIL